MSNILLKVYEMLWIFFIATLVKFSIELSCLVEKK